MEDCMKLDSHFVELHEDELEFLTDLAVNESQRWIEAVTRCKFRSPDFLESLEDGVLLCGLVDRIWPRYIQLDDSGVDDSFTRLYGQRTLEAFRGAAEKIGLEESVIFQPQHIHAPERYICSTDAQDAIQEALIRVTVTIYLLGWRAKETPTYPGPQLDLSAFDQLFQHYLRHLHNNPSTLCNRDLVEPDSLGSPDSERPQDSLEDNNPDSLDESNVRSEDTLVKEGMPSQEMAELEDTYSSGMRSHEGDMYRLQGRSGYYADSVGSSCDSACGSTSPSVAESHARQRSTDGMPHDEFVKPTKDGPSHLLPGNRHSTPLRTMSVDRDAIKQKLKEDEMEWEANLSNWKHKRKSNLPIMEPNMERTEEKSAVEKNVRTFPAMIADRLQKHGIPALYSDDDHLYQDEQTRSRPHSHTATKTTVDQPIIHAQDSSEKDSSSGVSSPRSSRSLTSVSPPVSPTQPPQPEFTATSNNVASGVAAPSPPPPAGPEMMATPIKTKKIISLTRLRSADGSVNDWKLLPSPNTVEEDPNKNPNIETTIKPFGEKLAMFEKAKSDPTVLDMNKCNYKDLAKPEQSLKDKLSVFESLEASSLLEDAKDLHPVSVSVKCTPRAAQVLPDPVVHELPVSPRTEPSGGLSRLLSKDLHSQVRMGSVVQPSLVPDSSTEAARDVTVSKRYMEEINGILGSSGVKETPALSQAVPDWAEDFPPPPLPMNPPPPVTVERNVSQLDSEPENRFPTPPPPLAGNLEEDNDNSQRSSLGSSDQQGQVFRRTDSTKRIKSDLSKRRSDYFGLKSQTPEKTSSPETPKHRPVGLHELDSLTKLAAPIPVTVKSSTHVVKNVSTTETKETKITLSSDELDDIDREQKSLADSLDLEEERWRKKVQRPVMRTQESAIASILEEYRKEMLKEREELEKREKFEAEAVQPVPVRKEALQTGILKRSSVPPSETGIKLGSGRSVDIPVTVLENESRTVPKPEDNKRVVIVERFEKVTEERRLNGRVEASSTEERRSFDHLTSDLPLPASRVPAPLVSLPQTMTNPIYKTTISQDQHYRDPSDGGYSSGRSDPGASVRTWLSQHPVSGIPEPVSDTRDYRITVENGPPRPPMPTEFRPPTYNTPISAVYQAQYTPKPVPVPPTRMQPKLEPAKKATISAVDVQKHWLVQEAEMRRLTDAETRQRAAAMAPPLPVRATVAPDQSFSTLPTPPIYRDAPGYRSENSSLGRGLVPSKTMDPYSSINRINTQPTRRFEEEAYNPPPEHIRTVVRSIAPVSELKHNCTPYEHDGYKPTAQPIVHRPNQPPASQARLQRTDAIKYPSEAVRYPTTHIPARISTDRQPPPPQTTGYYPPDPLLTHSVPIVSVHHQPQPKPYLPPTVTPPAFNRENAAYQSVSSKWPCARCGEFLGGNPSMIVENLKLVYHVACFKCVVCGQRLSDGSAGADVKVRDGRLHCNSCVSDEGVHMTML